MKKILTICNIVLFAIGTYAQNATFDWAKSIEGTSFDWAESIATDAMGNVYTTGYFQGTADFDPGIGTYNLTAISFYDIFVQKLDASGNFLWAKSMGSFGDERGLSISTDALGNAYVTGFFEGVVDFDPGSGMTNLSSNGSKDIFVLKLDNSGNFLWAISIGGTYVGLQGDRGFSIATDVTGNVYVSGVFHGTVDFDPGSGTFNLISSTYDIFVLNLDSSGNLLWAKSLTGTGSDKGWSISTDTSGVYLTGNFVGTADFDPGTGTHYLSTGGSDGDIFVLKLDHSGNFLWAIDIGASYDDAGWSVTSDVSGNVLVTGFFQGTVDFDPGPGTLILTSPASVQNNRDIFVLKLDGSGNFLWAKSMEGGLNDNEIGRDVAIDATGNVYITGYFEGTVDFDPGSGIYNLNSNGSNEIFILKLDASGNFVWAYAIGSTSDDRGYSIATDPSLNVYVTGHFNGTVDFDPGTGNFNLTSAGSSDVFILKLSQCASGSIDSITTCNSITWIDGNTYTTSNSTATHTLTNAAGCDSVVTLNLTINTVDNSVTQNGINLNANQTGASYQWLDCVNSFSIINGANSQNYTATVNGNYAVEIIYNGCVDTSACYTISTVGIFENDFGNNLLVFPNPTSGNITIELGMRFENIDVKVLNASAQIISLKRFTHREKLDIKIEGTPGNYFVEIITSGGKKATVVVLRE